MTIDRIFLGNFSTDALGAAMVAGSIFWAPMALVQQAAAYSTTFTAQYFGAKQFQMIGPSLWQSFYVSLLGGVLFLILIPLTPLIFQTVGHSETMQALEISYFRAICYSALPTALVAAVSGFYTGIGRSSVIIWINATGLVLNVLFDYIMIFGKFGVPEMGIAGAGYATVFANFGAAALGFALAFSKGNNILYATLSGWHLNLKLLLRFIKFGVPSGMQWALEGLAFTVFLVFIGRLPNGDAALSASSITVTIMMLTILPTLGIAQAVSVLVGQHLGADRPMRAERASRNGLEMAAIYILCVGISFLVFPEFYMSWFENSQNQSLWAEVSKIVPVLLMFVGLFTTFDSVNLVYSFALKGAGDTRFVSLVALLLPWPLMILPAWLVSGRPDGVYWAWGAASIYIIIQAIVFWVRFGGGKWKSMRVIEKTTQPPEHPEDALVLNA